VNDFVNSALTSSSSIIALLNFFYPENNYTVKERGFNWCGLTGTPFARISRRL
jgi:hypothetical protein